jgi:hypothetical protein
MTNDPAGELEGRIRRLLEHYESQTDFEAAVEDEVAWEDVTETTMKVPVDLVPAVLELIRNRKPEP